MQTLAKKQKPVISGWRCRKYAQIREVWKRVPKCSLPDERRGKTCSNRRMVPLLRESQSRVLSKTKNGVSEVSANRGWTLTIGVRGPGAKPVSRGEYLRLRNSLCTNLSRLRRAQSGLLSKPPQNGGSEPCANRGRQLTNRVPARNPFAEPDISDFEILSALRVSARTRFAGKNAPYYRWGLFSGSQHPG